MRRVAKILLAVALSVCLVSSVGARVSAAPAGLTVTPGTLTLTLATDATEQSTEFSLTNAYPTTITLRFAFESRADAIGTPSDVVSALNISRTELNLKPNESTTQKVTLHGQNLGPGSHLADLVITQNGGPATGVGVQPSVRIPLTILKQNGAVKQLTLTHFSVPRLNFSLPKTLTIDLQNSGNVIAIPRGTVTISKLGGSTLGQGVVNTGSTAMPPNGKLTATTPLTNMRSHPLLPGIYTATVQYGLGGDHPATVVSHTVLYVAWWHVIVLLAILLGGLYLLKQRRKATVTSTPGPRQGRVA